MIKSAGVLLITICALTSTAMAQKPGADAAQSRASLQATLEQREKEGWETFKNKDAKGYAATCAPEYTGVFADGAGEHNLQSAIDSMKEITLHSYSLSGFKLTPLGPNAALMTYSAVANEAMGNAAPQDIKLAVSNVWVKRGGEWKSLRYHETEVK